MTNNDVCKPNETDNTTIFHQEYMYGQHQFLHSQGKQSTLKTYHIFFKFYIQRRLHHTFFTINQQDHTMQCHGLCS